MLPFRRLSAYYFFYFAFVGAFAPYFALYLQSVGLGAWEIAVLMSLMQLMRLLAPNLWGWIADRSNAKMPIVRLAGFMSLVGFAGFFFAQQFSGFFFAMALLAFFWSASLPLVESLTLAHLSHEVSRYGSIRLWGSIGFIAAVAFIGWLLDRQPISVLLWVSLGILGGILLCALVLPDKNFADRGEETDSVIGLLRRPEISRLLAACFCMSAAHGALYVFYSIFLVEHGYGKSWVGALWTAGVVAEIGVFFFMPSLFRRFPVRTILLFSFACAVVRFLLIGWGVGSLAILFLAQLLHGATFGAYHASAIAAVSNWFAGRHHTRGQALYGSVSFGAGGMVGGLAAGYTWDYVGAPLTFTLSSVFALVGLALLAARQSGGRAVPHATSG